MVLVPAGCFMMGSDNGDSDEKPPHKVCFEQPFWIDKYEVTQAQFEQLGGKVANASYFTGDDLPVEQITWFESKIFCEARGARLPTEAEWEYAARGPESLVYPWGNEFDAGDVVFRENSAQKTANIDSKPQGVSWVGALNMSGNVAEWTSSLLRPYPYNSADGRENSTDTTVQRVVRGGSWNDDALMMRSVDRFGGNAEGWYWLDGFRCARSYQ